MLKPGEDCSYLPSKGSGGSSGSGGLVDSCIQNWLPSRSVEWPVKVGLKCGLESGPWVVGPVGTVLKTVGWAWQIV